MLYLCSMKEQWKQLKQNPNYFISNLGNIKGKYGLIRQNINHQGYYYCNICTNSVVSKVKIHRLVAIYFVVNPYDKETVNHIDENKLNNDYLNLEWLTRRENVQHYYNNRRLRLQSKT